MPGGRLGGRETLSGSPARDAVRPRPVGRTPTAEPALRSSVKAAFGRMAGERRSGPPAAGREDEGGEEAECEAGDVPGVAHGGRRERGGRDVEQREGRGGHGEALRKVRRTAHGRRRADRKSVVRERV